jgi:hypothetical protein
VQASSLQLKVHWLQEALNYTGIGATAPDTLGPVVAFQDQTGVVQAQNLVLTNVGNISHSFQVKCPPLVTLCGRLHATGTHLTNGPLHDR